MWVDPVQVHVAVNLVVHVKVHDDDHVNVNVLGRKSGWSVGWLQVSPLTGPPGPPTHPLTT